MRLIRPLLQRLAREEDGLALVMALAIVTILSVTTAGILLSGTTNQRETYVSNQAREAFATAEEALAYDEGMVYNAGNLGTTPPSGWQNLPTQPNGATGRYEANTTDGVTWTLTAQGTVGAFTRTVTATAQPPSTQTVTDWGVWNYLYQDSVANCLTINGGVTVSVPILARGNLCISGGAYVDNPASGSPITIYVGGKLSVTGISGSQGIGTSSSPVSAVGVAGCTAWNTDGTCQTTTTSSCTLQPNSVVTVAPGTNPCDGNHFPLYAKSVSSTLAVTPQMPCIGQPSSWDPQCTGSSNGTWSTLNTQYNTQASLPQSGCPAGLFDGNTKLDNSVSNVATKMLEYSYYPTPLSYDCKIGSAAKPCTTTQNVCEIKWQQTSTSSSNGTLYVNGVFYFDGSLSVGSGQKVVYTGQGTLYFTGTTTFAGGSQFCGIANCTTSWNPDVNGIIMVAGAWSNSTGSSLASTSVSITGGAQVQLGFYATTGYTAAGGTANMGPVLANTVTVSGGASTLIPFHTFPPGTPLSSTTEQLPGSLPTGWSG